MSTQLTFHDDAGYYDTLSTYAIVGSRDIDLPTRAITEAIRRTWYAFDLAPVDEVVTGDARGVDALVRRWHQRWTTPAESPDGLPMATMGHTIGLSVFRAYWETEGRKAGYLRTARMLTQTRPDVLIAITATKKLPRGTQLGMRLAYDMGIPVVWFTVGKGRLRASGAWNVAWRPSDVDLADDMLALQPEFTTEEVDG